MLYLLFVYEYDILFNIIKNKRKNNNNNLILRQNKIFK
jgi:hypothetical protein